PRSEKPPSASASSTPTWSARARATWTNGAATSAPIVSQSGISPFRKSYTAASAASADAATRKRGIRPRSIGVELGACTLTGIPHLGADLVPDSRCGDEDQKEEQGVLHHRRTTRVLGKNLLHPEAPVFWLFRLLVNSFFLLRHRL